MLTPPVSRYMTMIPSTVGPSDSLSTASRLLREHRIRHLPVVEGGLLVGVVSDRDLQLLDSLRAPGASDADLAVKDAMTTDVLAVAEDALLVDVVARMAARRCGSAVVMRHGRIAGIFTTVDALLALRDLLERPALEPRLERSSP
jgi:acetoin utilization protein AcuB